MAAGAEGLLGIDTEVDGGADGDGGLGGEGQISDEVFADVRELARIGFGNGEGEAGAGVAFTSR
jgi:hypothetical protein